MLPLDEFMMNRRHDPAGDTWNAMGYTWTDGGAARRFQQAWLALRAAYPDVIFGLDHDAQIIAWSAGDKKQPDAKKVAALADAWGQK